MDQGISMQCVMCVHKLDGKTCEAFPTEIPHAIFSGVHDHREPFDGDQGIRWEQAPAFQDVDLLDDDEE